MDSQQNQLITEVSEIYDQIRKLDSLKPSKEVNSLFTQLVELCIPPCPIDVSKLSKRVQQVRCELIRLCGEAESLLEAHFSDLIGSHKNPLDHVLLFPYYSNYLKLSHLEYAMLVETCPVLPTRVAFVGSGPLPLSSIILAMNYFKSSFFDNYDIDSSANARAISLISSDPDLSKRMFFHNADILSVSNTLKQYDVVFLAALVGLDKEVKARVIKHLAKFMAPGAILLLRSAHGARTFLYPVVELSDLQGFEVLSVFHPTDEVVNSVIVARKHLQGNGNVGLSRKCSEVRGFGILNGGSMVEEVTVDEQLS